jgi:HAD superfamily hydrolase (TIGR01509 family)
VEVALDRSGRRSYNYQMKIKAVIFDLDGTLTEPYLDFDMIRAEIGGIEGPILEAMDKMSAQQHERASVILGRYEEMAAENSRLNPGAAEVCSWIDQRGMAIGLVTRNQRRSVERVCQLHNLRFDSVVTREDGPVKPDPFAVRRACELMGVRPREAVMVGDYLFDLQSGRRAGALSVLLKTNKKCAEFEHEADYVISSLNELPGLLTRIISRKDAETSGKN